MIALERGTPRTGGAEIRHVAEADFLTQHPNEWFVVSTRSTIAAAWVFAHEIRIGKKKSYRPRGEFEASAHALDVLARYVGPTSNGGTDVPQKGSK